MTTSPITTVAIAASTALLAAAAYHQGKRAARLESESLLRRHSSSDGVCSADVSSKKVVRGSYTSGVEMNDYTRDGSSQTETSSPKLGFSFMTKLMLNHMKGAAAAAPVQQKMLLEGCSTVSSEEVVVSQDKIDDEADQCNSNDKVKTTDGAALKKTESTNEFDMLPIYPIGTLHSIYRLCVGTPRQGMLAPHSRGIITFHEQRVSRDSILELQHFSHVFVVFVFHLNSNMDKRASFADGADSNVSSASDFSGGQNGSHGKKSKRQFPSKIAPPSLGGKKVGIFSTRTPHRPNPIGFSLCKLDKVIVYNNKNKGAGDGATFSLLLSGLDIVDGTPILDIKPYVPHYDCVGYDFERLDSGAGASYSDSEPGCNKSDTIKDTGSEVKVPHWVDSGLQKRRNVTFLPEARQFLQDLISPTTRNTGSNNQSLDNLQFYGPHSPWKDSPAEAVENLEACMHQLLGVDVRSTWQTKKARKGKFQAERSTRVKNLKDDNTSNTATNGKGEDGVNQFCTQQIDNLLLNYTIEEPGSALIGNNHDADTTKSAIDERSKGSGAEDIVVVHSINFINANSN